MKYVIFQDKTDALWPVVLPDHIAHSQVAVEGLRPVSAGFVDLEKSRVFGVSASLKLKSNPDDWILVDCLLAGSDAVLLLLNHGL